MYVIIFVFLIKYINRDLLLNMYYNQIYRQTTNRVMRLFNFDNEQFVNYPPPLLTECGLFLWDYDAYFLRNSG